MFKNFLLVLLIILFALIAEEDVYAHPIDEIGDVNVYDQRQTLTVSPTKATLRIDLTFYAFEKMKVWGSINTDGDQNLTKTEKDRWMKMGSDSSWLEISGRKYPFEAKSVAIPDYEDFFSSKPVEIAIEFKSETDIKPGSQIFYFYKGKDKSLKEIAFDANGTDGIAVSELVKDSQDSATLTITEGITGTTKNMGVAASDRLNNFLDTYVKVEKISFGIFIAALAVSFLIGMLHALTPGHGKAIIAGYLVGEKGTISHAVQLGVIITVTHTLSVFLLGLGTLLLTQYIVPSTIIKWISLVSGFLVAGFGLYLLAKRLSNLRSGRNNHHHHSEFDEMIESGEHNHNHHHNHHNHTIELSWKNLLPLGISGGLVPCVDALAILIVAISLGKIALGLTLLLAFSLGLATALITGGIIVVFAKQKALKRFEAMERFEKYSSVVSACIVTILGIAIILGKPL